MFIPFAREELFGSFPIPVFFSKTSKNVALQYPKLRYKLLLLVYRTLWLKKKISFMKPIF